MAVVGAATVDVLPSLRGFSQAVRRQLGGVGNVGAQAGRQIGTSMSAATAASTSMAGATRRVGLDLSRLEGTGTTTGRRLGTNFTTSAGRAFALGPTTSRVYGQLSGWAAQTGTVTGTTLGSRVAAGFTNTRGHLSQAVINATGGMQAAWGGAMGRISSVTHRAADAWRNSVAASTGAMGGSFSRMAGVAGAAIAGIGMAALGAAAVRSAVDVERATAALTGLYGSADQARQMMGRLRAIASGSPIDFSAFTAGAESLAYMGIQGDQAVTVLQRIETAMVASGKGGESFNQVTEAMLAMVNQGKASAEEINRMSQAGFPAWEMLAEHMNMSIEEIRGAVESGEISIDDMVAAMEAGSGPTFQRMIAAQQESANTLSATWARVTDNIRVSAGEAFAAIVGDLAPAVGTWGTLIGSGIRDLPGIFQRLRDAVVNSGVAAAVGRIFGGIRDFIQGVRPALTGFVQGFGAAFAAITIGLQPLFMLLGAFGRLLGQNSGQVRIWGTAIGILVGVMVAARIATAAWAATMAILNAVSAANPWVLLVVAIVALVGAIIWAWNNVDWFRNAILGMWNAIVTAAQWAWTTILQPVFNALVTAAQAVAAAAMWLANGFVTAFNAVAAALTWFWTTVVQPVFNFISLAVRILAAIILTILVVPFQIWFTIMSAVLTAFWEYVVRPVFNAIGDFIGLVWNTRILPVWNAITGFINGVLVPGVQWLWNAYVTAWNAIAAAILWVWNTIISWVWNAIQNYINLVLIPVFNVFRDLAIAVWNAVAAGIQFVWNTVILPTWNALQVRLQQVGDFFRSVWENVIRPAWNAMGDGIRWVWDNIIRPAFDLLNQGTDFVGQTFVRVADWIRDTWQQIQGYASKPIKWVIDLVYNNGIVSVWNGIADMFGLGDRKLRPINTDQLIGYAKGGIHEDHTAQIARGGPIRLWNEPETHGEAYIPLARSKRRRSSGILAQVASEFGYTLAPKQLALFADGGIWRGMWQIVSRAFPGISLTSSYRPGDPGHHGTGNAIDVGYGDWSRHAAVAAWIAQNFPNSLELISAQFRGGVGIKNGRPLHYGEPTTSQHRNHVHWAMASLDPNAPVSPGGILGGLFDIGGWIRSLFQRVVDLVVPGEGGFVDMVKAAPGKLVDLVVDGATGLLQTLFASPVGAPGAGVERWRGVALQALTIAGQSHALVDRLLFQMQTESGGDPNVVNRWDSNWARGTPSVGLMQVIGPTYQANKHPQFDFGPYVYGTSVNPLSNILASIRYTLRRYGSLAAGWRGVGYDSGGWMPPGTSLVHNGYKKPEAVLTPSESAALMHLVRGGDDAAPVIGTYNNNYYGAAEPSRILNETLYRMRVAKLGGVHSAS